ncbi:hypothetical protein IPF86_00225 [Candidatus Nomurabacteria bacterium]|nr:MAG: hypothetical protein IPF86_00225 [Candidatus Nomurabacteria bacterium]
MKSNATTTNHSENEEENDENTPLSKPNPEVEDNFTSLVGKDWNMENATDPESDLFPEDPRDFFQYSSCNRCYNKE